MGAPHAPLYLPWPFPSCTFLFLSCPHTRSLPEGQSPLPCAFIFLHFPLLSSSSVSPLTVLVPFPNSSIRTRDCWVALFTAFATCWAPDGKGRVSLAFEACNTLTPVCLCIKLLVHVSSRLDCKFFNGEMHILFILSSPAVPRTKQAAEGTLFLFRSFSGAAFLPRYPSPIPLSLLPLTWLRSIMKVDKPRDMDSQL